MATNDAREWSLSNAHIRSLRLVEDTEVAHGETKVAVLPGEQEVVKRSDAGEYDLLVVGDTGLDFIGDLVVDGKESEMSGLNVGDSVEILSVLDIRPD